MSVTFTWLGQSAFTFDIDGKMLLVDPFLTGNPVAPTTADQLNPDLIYLSHGHGDHLGDTIDIATRTGATVVCGNEVGGWLAARGVNAHRQNPGGGFHHDFVHIKLTIAHHSSSMPDGSYGGEPTGAIITPKGSDQRIYYAGDTALFMDMLLIGEEGIDVAFLPIGDNFTMGPADSIRAIKMIKPRVVVPMHYNTWPMIAQDTDAWAARVRAETQAEPVVLKPGESHTA